MSFPVPGDTNTYDGTVLKSISTSYTKLNVDYHVTEFYGTEGFSCTQNVRNTLTEVIFPQNSALTTIQSFAFQYCSQLTNMDLSPCTKLSLIGKRAFYNCQKISSVTFPTGVSLELGERAFMENSALTSVFIPRTVSSIGFACFQRCQKMEVFNIEDNSTMKGINKWLFIYSPVKSFRIPASVEIITAGAFEAVPSLESITVEEGSTSFKEVNGAVLTFNGQDLVIFPPAKQCAVEIPQDVVILRGQAFAFSKITSVTFSSTVTSINDYCFRDSTLLTDVQIPDTVLYVREYAFYGCTNLQTLKLSNSITELFPSTFENCNLLRVEIPEGVVSVGNKCFAGNSNLEEIILPSTINQIGGSVFPSKEGLSIIFKSDLKLDSNNIIMDKQETYISQYIGTTPNFELNIVDSIQTIKNGAFLNKENLVKVICDQTNSRLTKIENEAFSGCTNLESFAFPNSLAFINSKAFYKCSKLTTLTFGSGLTKILESSFEQCSKITTVNLQNSKIEKLGDSAFYLCNELKEVNLPVTIKIFGPNCFKGCSKLATLQITSGALISEIGQYAFYKTDINLFNLNVDSNITEIGIYAFAFCSKLTEFSFCNSITTLGAYAFAWSGLQNVVLNDNINSIGSMCFYECNSVQKFTIPQGSKLQESGLGVGMFGKCEKFSSIECNSQYFEVSNSALFSKGLTKILIYPMNANVIYFPLPEKVTIIGDGAFMGCTKLSSILVSNNFLTTIGARAFEGCTMLHYINIPSSVTSVGEDAFKDCINLRCGVDIDSKDKKFISDLITNAKLSKNSVESCRVVTCKVRSLSFNVFSPLLIHAFFII